MTKKFHKAYAQMRAKVKQHQQPEPTAPRSQAVAAYNAFLRARIILNYGGPGDRVAAPPWQASLPEGQVGLWQQVVSAAQALGAEPDLYVWRVARDTIYRRAAQQLPELADEYAKAMARRAVSRSTILSEQYQCQTQLQGIYHSHLLRQLPSDSAMSAATAVDQRKVIYRVLCSGARPMQPAGEGNLLDVVYRWATAKRLGFVRLADDMFFVAGPALWIDRDLYTRCPWFVRDAGGVAAVAAVLRQAQAIYRGL